MLAKLSCLNNCRGRGWHLVNLSGGMAEGLPLPFVVCAWSTARELGREDGGLWAYSDCTRKPSLTCHPALIGFLPSF